MECHYSLSEVVFVISEMLFKTEQVQWIRGAQNEDLRLMRQMKSQSLLMKILPFAGKWNLLNVP